MERNIMRSALRAGAVPIRDEIKARAPVDTGALRDSVRITTRAKAGQVSASVKVGNKTAWYAFLTEFGTRPHKILPKRVGGALRFGGTEARSVEHPGIAGHPFIRPGVDAAFTASVTAVQAKVRQRLTKQGIDVPDAVPSDPEE
ncbi:hypothetical protein Q3G72_014462 [Acer saccharum]|nr:hypothetical protein Q3G72_014462 [Acer saccharum]